MPILHCQIGGQAKTPDGKLVVVPGGIALWQRGPVLQVSVTVAQTVAQILAQQGKPSPAPLSGFGLIDTGASVTCVDQEAAQQLGVPVVDVVSMCSASDPATQQNVYPIQIEVVGVPIRFQAPRAIGAALKAQGLLLLIGRDVLQVCTLFYNGLTGAITLSI